MRLKFILPLLAVVLLVIGCCLPWMTIETKGLAITGLNTKGTLYGKPGYFHFLWAGLYLGFLLIDKVWAKRVAIGVAAFNVAWAARNFLLIPICQMGECPVRQAGLYLLLLASLAMFVAPMFGQNRELETN